MADGCIWRARERWEECSEASSVRRGTVDGSEAGVMRGGVAGSGGSRLGARKRGQRWEADLVRGGVANGGRGWPGAVRCGQWWRHARCEEEELPMGAVRSTTHRGRPAGGADAVVPHVGRGWMVVEHRGASRRLAGGERRVKTQPGLGRACNDDT
uniref:Uncharacterized protein n=1 Tax=Oryza rufipogon TaxID=4529 RepID=A0A0E0PIN0_ORYRU